MMLNETCYKLLSFVKSYQDKNSGRSPSYQEMSRELNLKSKASVHRVIEKLVDAGALAKQGGVMRSLTVLYDGDLMSTPVFNHTVSRLSKNSARSLFEPGVYGCASMADCFILPIYTSRNIVPADKQDKREQKSDKPTVADLFRLAIKSLEEDGFDIGEDGDACVREKSSVSFEPIGTFALQNSGFDGSKRYFAYLINSDAMSDIGVFKDDIIILESCSTLWDGECGTIVIDENVMVFKRIKVRHNSYFLKSEGGSYSTQTILKNRARITGKMIGLYRGHKLHSVQEEKVVESG